MGKRKQIRADRKRKRSFCGNQYTNKRLRTESVESRPVSGDSGESFVPSSVVVSDRQHATASTVKLQSGPAMDENIQGEDNFDQDPELTGFRFLDAELLVNFVQSLLCPNCRQPLGENTRLSRVTENRSALSSEFVFTCHCQHKLTLNTSKQCGKTTEVSRRFILSMLSIGRNLKHGEKLLGSMNMPYKVNKSVWYQHKKKITKATAPVAANSKRRAAVAVCEQKGRDITVSNDGSWQRRGFQSKNGVVTTLTVNGKESKVIDTHVLSSHCDSCAKNRKKLTADEFDRWYVGHEEDCEKNHEGSAGSMEAVGTETIFRRSQELYGLRYTGFLGDGDSKSFTSVHDAQPAIYDTEIKCL